MPRYIIADPALGNGWGHIFSENGVERERITRFVFDTDANSLIHVDIQRAAGERAANAAEIADLEDSLKNANSDALDDPDSWGLIASDALPAWCPEPAVTPPAP